MYLLKVLLVLCQAEICVISAVSSIPIDCKSKKTLVLLSLASADCSSGHLHSEMYSISRTYSSDSPRFVLYMVPSKSSTDACLLALSFFSSIRFLLNDL